MEDSKSFFKMIDENKQADQEICYVQAFVQLIKQQNPEIKHSVNELINLIIPFPYKSLNGHTLISVLEIFSKVLVFKYNFLSYEDSVQALKQGKQLILGFHLFSSQCQNLVNYYKQEANKKNTFGLSDIEGKQDSDKLCGLAVLANSITDEGSILCQNFIGYLWGDNGKFRIKPDFLKNTQHSVPYYFIQLQFDQNISGAQRDTKLNQYKEVKKDQEKQIKNILYGLNFAPQQKDNSVQGPLYGPVYGPQMPSNNYGLGNVTSKTGDKCPDCDSSMSQQNHGQGNISFQCQRCGKQESNKGFTAFICNKCSLFMCDDCSKNKPEFLSEIDFDELSKQPQIQCGKCKQMVSKVHCSSNWSCNQCKRSSKQKIRYNCQPCDWDICFTCLSKPAQ